MFSITSLDRARLISNLIIEENLKVGAFVTRNIENIVERIARIYLQCYHLEEHSKMQVSGDYVFLLQCKPVLDGIIYLGSTTNDYKETKKWLENNCDVGRVEPIILLRILVLVHIVWQVIPVVHGEDAAQFMGNEQERLEDARAKLLLEADIEAASAGASPGGERLDGLGGLKRSVEKLEVEIARIGASPTKADRAQFRDLLRQYYEQPEDDEENRKAIQTLREEIKNTESPEEKKRLEKRLNHLADRVLIHRELAGIKSRSPAYRDIEEAFPRIREATEKVALYEAPIGAMQLWTNIEKRTAAIVKTVGAELWYVCLEKIEQGSNP